MTMTLENTLATSLNTGEDAAYEHALRIYLVSHHSNTSRARLIYEIAQFDAFGRAQELGAASTGAWLVRNLGMKTSTAYEYVAVGRKLLLFDALMLSFLNGEVDYTVVRLLLRYMTLENELELLELARGMCYSELEKALAGGEQDQEKPEAPFFKTWVREDGMVVGEFLLPPVEGQELMAALKIAQLAAAGDGGEDAAEACPAEQVEDAKPERRMTADSILGVPSRYGPPVKADLYAALVTMVQMVRSNPQAPVRAPGAQVTIMLTEDGKAWMPTNPQAPSSTLRHYVKDAVTRVHMLDSKGLTMHFGKKRRLASDGQVEALLDVWGHQCAMPGCTHSRFIEIHHITDWSDGGTTDIGNLIPLCSSCHSLVSHGVAEVVTHGPNVEFRFMDGSKFISRSRGLPVRAGGVEEVRTGTSFA